MPTYTYRCQHGHEFEVEQKITAAPLTECAEQWRWEDGKVSPCLAPVKRLIGASITFTLTGDG